MNTFATGGFSASGTADVDPTAQVVNLRGGGFCGWIMPTPVRYNPFNPSPGMPNLKLDCAARSRFSVSLNLCLDLTQAARNSVRVSRRGDRNVVRESGRPVAELGLDGRVRAIR